MSLNTLPATFTIGTAFFGLSALFFPAPSVQETIFTAAANVPAQLSFGYGYGQHLISEVDAHLANVMVGTTSALVTLYAANNLNYFVADTGSVMANNGEELFQLTVKAAEDFHQGGLINATATPRWTTNNAVHIPSRRAMLSGLTGVTGMEPARACSKDSPPTQTARKVAEFRRRVKETNATPPAQLANISININVTVVAGGTKGGLVSRFWSDVHTNFLAVYDLLEEEDFDQGDFFGVFDIRAGFRDLVFEGSDSEFGLDLYDDSFSSSHSIAEQTLSANDQFDDDDILLELDIDISGGQVFEPSGADYDFHDDGVVSALGYTALSALVAWYLFSRPSAER